MYLVSEKELIGDSTLKMEIQKSNNKLYIMVF